MEVHEQEALSPRQRLESAARASGLPEAAAQEDADRALGELSGQIRYPESEPPERLPQEELSRALNELLTRLDQQKRT